MTKSLMLLIFIFTRQKIPEYIKLLGLITKRSNPLLLNESSFKLSFEKRKLRIAEECKVVPPVIPKSNAEIDFPFAGVNKFHDKKLSGLE